MPAEIEPPELAQLLDTAERLRAGGWSLRAALTRYAQPEPQRASDVIEALRRIEFAVHPHLKTIEREGPAVWAAVQAGGQGGQGDVDPFLVAVLQALALLDRLADDLASWAVERAGERPDDEVDAVVADVNQRLAELGVPREEGPPPEVRARQGRGRARAR